jgi:hypothetical protein
MPKLLKFSCLNLNICKWVQIFLGSDVIGCRTSVWSICKKKIISFRFLEFGLGQIYSNSHIQIWIFWIFIKVNFYFIIVFYSFLWIQGYSISKFCTCNCFSIIFTRLNVSRSFNNFAREVVRKSCSDGKTFYTKVVENWIIKSMQEESSKMGI